LTYTDLSNKPKSKRQQIWRLVSEGKLTPKAIALKVNTTVENVWKEKSLLKSRGGLIVSRSTSQRSSKQSETIVFEPDEQEDRSPVVLQKMKTRKINGLSEHLMDIPQLDSEGLRTLYREFKSGKKPIDILAEHGFHPEVVEIEYRRFIELSERDSDEFLKRLMLNLTQKGHEKEPVWNINIKRLIGVYHQRGYLTNSEILELLAEYTKEKVQEELELLVLDKDRNFPSGFRRLRCAKCNEKLLDVILSDRLPLGKELADKYDGKIRCGLCRQDTTYDDSS
jgi:hypothetical protein